MLSFLDIETALNQLNQLQAPVAALHSIEFDWIIASLLLLLS